MLEARPLGQTAFPTSPRSYSLTSSCCKISVLAGTRGHHVKPLQHPAPSKLGRPPCSMRAAREGAGGAAVGSITLWQEGAGRGRRELERPTEPRVVEEGASPWCCQFKWGGPLVGQFKGEGPLLCQYLVFDFAVHKIPRRGRSVELKHDVFYATGSIKQPCFQSFPSPEYGRNFRRRHKR